MSLALCDDASADWKERALGLKDALELFRGKWKFVILKNLAHGPLRFNVLQERLSINPKVLTRELRELEQNLLVARTIKKTKYVTVEYTTTEYARDTRWILEALIEFGENHRRKIKAQVKG